MNTTREKPARPARRANSIWMLPARFPRASVAIVLLVLAAVAVLASTAERGSTETVLTEDVKRGPLVISVSESGTIQSRERVVIKCEVEGRTTILYIIPEGTYVKPGDLLVELDSSNLEDRKTSQQITVMNAEASYVRARESLEVTRSQGESDVSKAQLQYDFAQVDLKKYLEGEYPQQLQRAQADITLSTEEQQRAESELEGSRRLESEGFITKTELIADELAKKRADLNLKQAEVALKLLEEYTYPRQVEQLKSDVEQTEMALDRAKRKAAADMVQAEADLKARESEFNRQKTQLDKTVSQLDKCRITAPVAGMVVYATTGRGGPRGGSQQPLDEGQEVRERQDIIYLPTTAAMIAQVGVQESSLRKVAVGMPVRLSVDALPGAVLTGRVSKIALLPDAQSAWLNPDLKVYTTEVQLDKDVEGLRPGMSCRAEIVVQKLDDVLYVPIQSVIQVAGKPTVYVQNGRTAEPRTIEVGYDNDSYVHVTAGLEAGEKVLLTPPLAAGAITPEEQAAAVAGLTGEIPAPGEGEGSEAVEGSAEAGQATFDPAKFRSMTREERQKYMESLSEEERQKVREQFGGRERGTGTPGRGGSGRPGRPAGGEAGGEGAAGGGQRPSRDSGGEGDSGAAQ